MVKSENLRERTVPVLFFAALFLILLIKLKSPFNFYDEGLVMISATRVSQGEIPYRDFWGIYPPTQFYVIGALFKLLGNSILIARIYDTLIRFVLVIAVFLIVQKIASRRYAYFAAGIIGLMLATIGFYSYPIFPASALGLWAVWCWLNFAYSRQQRWLILAGTLLGVTALMRWDVFLYAGISIGISAYLFVLFSPTPEEGAIRSFSVRALVAPLKSLAGLLAPMLIIPLIGYGLLTLYSGWSNVFGQVFYFPATMLHSVRWLAYPTLLPNDFPPSEDWQRFYLPILILALAGTTLVVCLVRKRGRLEPGYYGILTLILYGALMFNQGLSRYDYIHVLPSSILCFMACLTLSQRVLPQLHNSRWRYATYALMAVAALVYFGPAVKEVRTTLRTFTPWGCFSQLAKLDCVAVDPNQQQAVEYIQNVTQPSDPIFVGNIHHDRIFVNDVGFYYLAGRSSATRYQELHPGLANTLPVQKEIAAELEAKQVQWIVLVDIWDSTEPNDSAVSTGVYFLDDYLVEHYQAVTAFGQYHIAKRR